LPPMRGRSRPKRGRVSARRSARLHSDVHAGVHRMQDAGRLAGDRVDAAALSRGLGSMERAAEIAAIGTTCPRSAGGPKHKRAKVVLTASRRAIRRRPRRSARRTAASTDKRRRWRRGACACGDRGHPRSPRNPTCVGAARFTTPRKEVVEACSRWRSCVATRCPVPTSRCRPAGTSTGWPRPRVSYAVRCSIACAG